MHTTAYITALAGFVLSTYAQASNPFTIIGHLESLSLGPIPTYNAGGQVTVAGRQITVPSNLMFDFPAAYIPFRDLFDAAGTAPLDFPAPSTANYEVEVFGNLVDGQNIAGRISIGQGLTNVHDGFIQSINYSNITGEPSIQIAGGPKLRISDPNAVFSGGYNKYPYFTADDESASVVSFGGFPMCIPRVAPPQIDPLCPTTNRPGSGSVRSFVAPNPKVMAPLAVGDFLTFSGVRTGDNEVVAYEISANVGIRTPTGTPGFLTVEENIVGVIDSTGQFETAETRWVGYVTDATAAVTISVVALDIDACTGAETERLITSFQPATIANDPRGKFDVRTRKGVPAIGQITREYRFKLSTGTAITLNGIVAGQYVSPINEVIFPESVAPGTPTGPHEFEQFEFLAQGSGPDGNGNIFGQLAPWPGAFAPTIRVPVCPVIALLSPNSEFVPVAFAGEDVATRGGVIVTLQGANQNATVPEAALSYSWVQTSGPIVTLSSPTAAKPTFTAPAAAGIVVREFNLTITPTKGSTSTDSVIVTTNSATVDIVTIDSYTRVSKQGGTISVSAHSNVVGVPNSSMSISVGGAAFLPMQNAGPGRFTYTQRSVGNVAIRLSSDFGGTATASTPTAARLAADGTEVSAEEPVAEASVSSDAPAASEAVSADAPAASAVVKRNIHARRRL